MSSRCYSVVCLSMLILMVSISNCAQHIVKMQDEPIVKVNPTGCDEFIIQKNFKQVVSRISLVPGSEILFSNESKLDLVCPNDKADINTDNTVIDVAEICEGDISCTLFEKIVTHEDSTNYQFKYRAEQCFETLHVLVVYPPLPVDGTEHQMSIQAEYIDDQPCFTVSGGVHEVVNTDTQCGQKSEDLCEETVRCSLVQCLYKDGSNRTEGVCLPRATSKTAREYYCSLSGLNLDEYGELPLDSYGTWTIIFSVIGICFVLCFCMGCFYNLRLYQNKKAPFKVPAFCPNCCFPRAHENYNYSFENEGEGSNSLEGLDNNQVRGSTRRGTTKYRAPNFYFEDD